MTLRRFCLALAALLLCLAGVARADLTVDIVGGGAKRYPISIAPLAAESTLPQPVTSVVRSDLALTGMFQLVDAPSGLAPATPDEFRPQDWQALGVSAVAIGSAGPADGGKLRVTFALLQNPQKTVLTSGEFVVVPGQLRDVGHRIADMIYQALMGEPGFFSSRLAFVLKRGSSYELQVADVDGARARTVLRSREPIISPAWSPDGGQLAYVSFETGKPVVYVQDLSSGRRHAAANFKGSNSAPAWSPDGRRLAVTLTTTGNSQIYLVDAAGGGLARRLTRSDAIDTEPDFSPDGQSIVFTSDRSGGPQIYIQPAGGGEARRVSWQGNYNVSPRFSPDGKSLTYVRREGGRFRVIVQDLASGDSRIVSDTGYGESPSFAPNGRMVLYAASEGGRSVLYAATPDGLGRARLAQVDGEVQDPAWGPKP